MNNDQINAYAGRLVLCFEKIAAALEGINETYRWHYERQYPEKKVAREAVVTRVPTEEDRIREDQQGDDGLFGNEGEWNEEIGVREREWLTNQGQVSYARPQARPPVWSEEGGAGAAPDQGE